MPEIPSARVVREGTRDGAAVRGRGAAPIANVLRLAPRAVPRSLRWRMYFGGPMSSFGWLFGAVGMVFVLAFLPMMDLGCASHDRHTSATLTRVEDTRSSENERRIHRVHYTFVDDAGVERRGTSYTTSPPPELGLWPVAYRSGEPSSSQLQGMRRRPHSALVLLVLVFPLAGLAVALASWPRARRDLRLLRHGVVTTGKLIHKEPTRVHVDDVPVMALTFEYKVDGAVHTAVVKTLTPEPLEDDAREVMLYDPYRPANATPIDHLPGSPKITASGELEAERGFVIHLLILPAMFVGGVVATVLQMV